jgi:hypothetical protein
MEGFKPAIKFTADATVIKAADIPKPAPQPSVLFFSTEDETTRDYEEDK